jgi:hypothetical protein
MRSLEEDTSFEGTTKSPSVSAESSAGSELPKSQSLECEPRSDTASEGPYSKKISKAISGPSFSLKTKRLQYLRNSIERDLKARKVWYRSVTSSQDPFNYLFAFNKNPCAVCLYIPGYEPTKSEWNKILTAFRNGWHVAIVHDWDEWLTECEVIFNETPQ